MSPTARARPHNATAFRCILLLLEALVVCAAINAAADAPGSGADTVEGIPPEDPEQNVYQDLLAYRDEVRRVVRHKSDDEIYGSWNPGDKSASSLSVEALTESLFDNEEIASSDGAFGEMASVEDSVRPSEALTIPTDSLEASVDYSSYSYAAQVAASGGLIYKEGDDTYVDLYQMDDEVTMAVRDPTDPATAQQIDDQLIVRCCGRVGPSSQC